MNRRITSLATVGLGGALLGGALLAGCSSGSGGSDATGGLTGMAGVSSNGVQRAPGYDWDEAVISSDVQASVVALGVSGVGSASATVDSGVASLAPGRELLDVASGASQTLPFQGAGFQAIGSDLYVATGGAPGAGDVYVRTPAGWSVSLDADQDALVLAESDGQLVGVGGASGMPGVLHRFDPALGTWSGETGPSGGIPSAAASFQGELWVGLSADGEGAATLLRGLGFSDVTLEGAVARAGVRQAVTALLSAPRGLVVALGDFDAVSGEALSGQLSLLVPGEAERLLGTYAGEAPLALAFQDETLYVGTSSGRLQFFDAAGRLSDEPNLPSVTAIHALATPSATTLLVGCASDRGALILTRLARSAQTTTPATTTPAATPPATTTGGSGPDYVNEMKVLLGSCSACHATMPSNYTLSNGLSNDMADYQATLGQVDLGNPAGSALLAKTSGAVAHAGGALWAVGSTQYDQALAWITAGAPFEVVNRTTPPADPVPALPTYVTDVRPIALTCATCHDGTRTDDMRLTTGLVDNQRDYQSLLREVNLGDPTRSGILREPSRGGEHPKIFDVGSLPYQILLKWIETGATFQ